MLKIYQEIAEFNARRWWQKMLRHYPNLGPIPEIKVSARLGKTLKHHDSYTLGRARCVENRAEQVVILSARGMSEYPDIYPDDVIPHELAHIGATRLFECWTHGKPWRDMIKVCGIDTDIYIDVHKARSK